MLCIFHVSFASKDVRFPLYSVSFAKEKTMDVYGEYFLATTSVSAAFHSIFITVMAIFNEVSN